MLVIKMALALGLASNSSMSAFTANTHYSASQSQEWISSNSSTMVSSIDDMNRDEELTSPEQPFKKSDRPEGQVIRQKLFQRYFPKNWSWF